jgi:hypothetical protein
VAYRKENNTAIVPAPEKEIPFDAFHSIKRQPEYGFLSPLTAPGKETDGSEAQNDC